MKMLAFGGLVAVLLFAACSSGSADKRIEELDQRITELRQQLDNAMPLPGPVGPQGPTAVANTTGQVNPSVGAGLGAFGSQGVQGTPGLRGEAPPPEITRADYDVALFRLGIGVDVSHHEEEFRGFAAIYKATACLAGQPPAPEGFTEFVVLNASRPRPSENLDRLLLATINEILILETSPRAKGGCLRAYLAPKTGSEARELIDLYVIYYFIHFVRLPSWAAGGPRLNAEYEIAVSVNRS